MQNVRALRPGLRRTHRLKIAQAHPDRITAIITQTGNAYTDGFTPFWEPLFAYATAPGPDTEPAVRSPADR